MHNFLELKRNQYPRLYILGDEDLMEILGNFKNRKTLNKIVCKIFPGLKKLTFTGEDNMISGGVSQY